VTHCKPLVQLSRGSGEASRIRILHPVPAPCTPRIAYIIIRQLRAKTHVLPTPLTKTTTHPLERRPNLPTSPPFHHPVLSTNSDVRVVEVNLEGSGQSSSNGPNENLSSLVSGYFWHITDIHYDANYVATADYAQSEYYICIIDYSIDISSLFNLIFSLL